MKTPDQRYPSLTIRQDDKQQQRRVFKLGNNIITKTVQRYPQRVILYYNTNELIKPMLNKHDGLILYRFYLRNQHVLFVF